MKNCWRTTCNAQRERRPLTVGHPSDSVNLKTHQFSFIFNYDINCKATVIFHYLNFTHTLMLIFLLCLYILTLIFILMKGCIWLIEFEKRVYVYILVLAEFTSYHVKNYSLCSLFSFITVLSVLQRLPCFAESYMLWKERLWWEPSSLNNLLFE